MKIYKENIERLNLFGQLLSPFDVIDIAPRIIDPSLILERSDVQSKKAV